MGEGTCRSGEGGSGETDFDGIGGRSVFEVDLRRTKRGSKKMSDRKQECRLKARNVPSSLPCHLLQTNSFRVPRRPQSALPSTLP